jgi:hypothetical protein
MKIFLKFLFSLYTIFFGIIIGIMLYLHIYYPGRVIPSSILIINYNIWQTYVLITLLYIGALIEAVVDVKIYSFIKNRLHFHN